MYDTFYVYAYLREDNSPYYIGKGKDNRAWKKGEGEIYPPRNKSKIVIMENNLTEIGALSLERRYIKWYGRKDNGTGILRNKTDGGEGASGVRRSEEYKQRASARMLGAGNHWRNKKHKEETLLKMRKPKPEGFGLKISAYQKGREKSEKHKENLSLANIGKKQTDETKLKRSLCQLGIPKPKIICDVCGKSIGGPGNMKKHINSSKCK